MHVTLNMCFSLVPEAGLFDVAVYLARGRHTKPPSSGWRLPRFMCHKPTFAYHQRDYRLCCRQLLLDLGLRSSRREAVKTEVKDQVKQELKEEVKVEVKEEL